MAALAVVIGIFSLNLIFVYSVRWHSWGRYVPKWWLNLGSTRRALFMGVFLVALCYMPWGDESTSMLQGWINATAPRSPERQMVTAVLLGCIYSLGLNVIRVLGILTLLMLGHDPDDIVFPHGED